MPKSHPSDPTSELLGLAERLGHAVSSAGVPARLLGGVAIALRCPAARAPSPLAREYSDLDFAARRRGRDDLELVLAAHGFAPAERFNAMNGRSRLRFDAPDGLHVDVFIEQFDMCHKLELGPRIDRDTVTLPLADLLLTKLQVAELNRKDVGDVVALLADHPLTVDDTGIDIGYVTGVLGRDWGWWRTVTGNLAVVVDAVASLGLDRATTTRVQARVTELRSAIDAAPKTFGWKARSKVGDRVAWRQIPEEPTHGGAVAAR